MKKNQKQEEEEEEKEEHDIESLKAAAQAWHGHSSSRSNTATATLEFDAHRLYFKSKPSRFRLEDMSMEIKRDVHSTSWDFRQSLWDSYEIVTVSKKLETGLMGDDPFSGLGEQGRYVKRQKESKNSLRNLFNRMSSKKFKEDELTARE